MDLIFLYILFALTTAFTFMYEVYSPVFKALEEHNPNNNVVENKIVSFSTFFLIAFVVAPALLFVCLIPSLGEIFRNSLLKSLTD